MKIYVCSPLKENSHHTMWTNQEKAKEYCRFVAIETGNTPIAPHIYCTEFLKDDIPEERNLGMDMGLELLETCREVWVFGGHISDGMAKEIELAFKKRMPVKFFTDDCKRRNEDEPKTSQKDEN